jgi:transcriptional regulator of acetoin/glycerol metabolism
MDEGGTLFLDEIGELPLSLQSRLLRVLETGEVRRVGAETARQVDFRLVCATHRDLRAMVAEGAFREDLYFRIARLVIDLPPLRERAVDIQPIAERLLAELTGALGPRELSDEALARLVAHSWPGNVRELRNVVSAAAAATVGTRIEREDIERALCRIGGGARVPLTDETVQSVLARYRGNLSAAARALGMPRSTLRDRARQCARER